MQEAVSLILYHSPIMWLVNSSVAIISIRSRQSFHLIAPQHPFLGALYVFGVSTPSTRRSFKFFGQQKAINSGKGNALWSCLEVWRMCRCCLVVNPRDDIIWWQIYQYVLMVYEWTFPGHCVVVSPFRPLVMFNANWTSESHCCSLYPPLMIWYFNFQHHFWWLSFSEQILRKRSE